MYASLNISGITPSFMLFLKIIWSGVLMYFFVFMRKTVGIPSGPAAEFLFSLSIAFAMSSSLKSISMKSYYFMTLVSLSDILSLLLLLLN